MCCFVTGNLSAENEKNTPPTHKLNNIYHIFVKLELPGPTGRWTPSPLKCFLKILVKSGRQVSPNPDLIYQQEKNWTKWESALSSIFHLQNNILMKSTL